MTKADRMIDIARDLSKQVGRLRFGGSVVHVYNPLDYAWEAHKSYLRRFVKGRPTAILLGMNPGPFGMVQTGVPFGDVGMVRDWLGIKKGVKPPKKQHPKRPIEGFAIGRGEVSGQRLWGWVRERFGTPTKFFRDFFILNYCPLAFLGETGKNITPDKLTSKEREKLFRICDRALNEQIECLNPAICIGIGKFAEKRLRVVLKKSPRHVGVALHPSPASPKANRAWPSAFEADLSRYDLPPIISAP